MNLRQLWAFSGDVHIWAHMNNIPICISVLTLSWFSYNTSLSCDQQGLSELEPPWIKWVKKDRPSTNVLQKLLPPGLKVPLLSLNKTVWVRACCQVEAHRRIQSSPPPLTAPEISEAVGKWQLRGYGADVTGFTCDGISLICMVAFEMHSEVVLRVPIHLDRSPHPLNSTSIHLMNQSIPV